jgi:hypothetical protein
MSPAAFVAYVCLSRVKPQYFLNRVTNPQTRLSLQELHFNARLCSQILSFYVH